MLTTIVFLSTLISADVSPPEFSAPNEELRMYLREAVDNDPGLRARHTDWLSFLQEIPQVTSLDDPMFMYGQFLQSDVNRMKFNITQKFPWFGTLRVRGEEAAARADAALERFYSARNRLFTDVKRAYFEYAFLGKSVRVARAQTEVITTVENLVRSRYSLGLASEASLLRVQIENAIVQDRMDAFLEARSAFSARLAESMGRSPAGDLPWPQEEGLPAPPPSRETAIQRIRDNNPDLKAFEHLIESRARQFELAKKKNHPDFTLGLDYTSVSRPRQIRPDRPFPASLHGARRLLTGTSPGTFGPLIDLYAVANYDEPISYRSGGRDNILFSIRMNVPIRRKRIKAGVERASLLKAAAELDKHDKRLALEAAGETVLFHIDDASRRTSLYDTTLLPQARQTYQSLNSAYGTGALEADFIDLLDSLRVLLAFELEEIQAVRDVNVASADLEFLMGGPLDDSGSRE